MHAQLIELSNRVGETASGLPARYAPKQLYAFRVSVRRIRSILKQIDSHQSRRYRKIWGGFAAITNDARDWDVFLKTVKNLLPAPEYREFRELNRVPVRHSRESVIEMLQSAHWERHLLEWSELLGRTEEQALISGESLLSLEQSLARARLALDRALEINDDHSWHKLRIRVKEIRYLAEAGVEDVARGIDREIIVESCKQLQTMLGDWHDTVVQLNLLGQLPSAPVHETLEMLISERKQMLLDQIRQVVRGHPLFAEETGYTA